MNSESRASLPPLYVALDFEQQSDVIAFARRLAQGCSSCAYGFKVNLDSLVNFSSAALLPRDFLSELLSLSRSLFVDLKMWNGLRTMYCIVEGCAELGVDIVNVYAHCGLSFISGLVDRLRGRRTSLFCVSILTHYDDAYVRDVYGGGFADVVPRLASIAERAGADGVILPATKLELVSQLSLSKLCPGIRPKWHETPFDNQQKQILSPREALERGADHVVIGTPITRAKDPLEALGRVLAEVSG